MTDRVQIAHKEQALDDYIDAMLGNALAPPQSSIEQLLSTVPDADEKDKIEATTPEAMVQKAFDVPEESSPDLPEKEEPVEESVQVAIESKAETLLKPPIVEETEDPEPINSKAKASDKPSSTVVDESNAPVVPKKSLGIGKCLSDIPGFEPKSKKQESKSKTEVKLKERTADPLAAAAIPVAEPVVKVKTDTKPKEPIIKVSTAKPKVEVKVETSTEVAEQVAVEAQVEVPKAPVFKSYKDADWAQEDFQCLFFKIGGLTVAVPLIKLGGIHVMEDLNHIPAKPSWYLGLMPQPKAKNIHVVDSAMWIMPERYNQVKESLDYRHVVMMGGSQWGLAAGDLTEAVRLSPRDIQWRESSGKRPWIAGIVKQRMCTLLNVESLIFLLDDYYKQG